MDNKEKSTSVKSSKALQLINASRRVRENSMQINHEFVAIDFETLEALENEHSQF